MTDPFDTVREGLVDLSPPFGTLHKARAALASIEERLDKLQRAFDTEVRICSERTKMLHTAELRLTVSAQAVMDQRDRAEAAEQERDEERLLKITLRDQFDALWAEKKEIERKAKAYDRARTRVKIEGATRAEWVLQWEAAEARCEALTAALREIADYYEENYVEGEKAYQAAAVARAALASGKAKP